MALASSACKAASRNCWFHFGENLKRIRDDKLQSLSNARAYNGQSHWEDLNDNLKGLNQSTDNRIFRLN